MDDTKAAVGAGAKEYETVYVLRPDVTKENLDRVSTRVDEVVKREGGQLTLVESWGRRQLAYTVRKHRRGVYFCVKYVGTGRIVSELERNLRMFDDVLKYQTVFVRAGVDTAQLAVSPEDVKFEDVEPMTEEEDMSPARLLGLEDSPLREQRHSNSFDDLDDRGRRPRVQQHRRGGLSHGDPHQSCAAAERPPTWGRVGTWRRSGLAMRGTSCFLEGWPCPQPRTTSRRSRS